MGSAGNRRAMQSRYFRHLERSRRLEPDISSDSIMANHQIASDTESIEFPAPQTSYSPERYNGYSRSNSTSPVRNSVYETSPNRRLLQSSNTINENPFMIPVSSKLTSSSFEMSELHNYNNLKINGDPSRRKYYQNHNEDPTDSIFGGYDFDADEMNSDEPREFTPFPETGNSYYQLNTPFNVYNPFETIIASDENYSDDEDDDNYDDNFNISHETNCSLQRRDTQFKNAKAVQDTIEYYNINKEAGNEGVGRTEPSAKQVRMVDGNLVLDCPVSDILLNKYKVSLSERDREFLFMRFQACTAEPEDFQLKKFSLRQKFYTRPRDTELMIVITMYNEDDILLARTLKGVFKNIRYLYNMKHSSTWGKNSWQKVVVCIVSDGRQKIHPRSKALLAALGVYQEGFAKNKINDDDVVSHIYEYTTLVGISKIFKDRITLTTENQVPIQMIFCLKEQNKKKINSHKWAFKAFAPVLNPNVIILLDVGTEPEHKSLYKLWKSFKDNPKVAGSCGEIKASLGSGWNLLLNPLVAAQNFEYKTSNILDKPMESVFGFVTVLPGAFSAYRYEALIGDPIEKYLKGEDLKKNNDDGIFNANMYLAEDRILCFELVAKRNERWILKYINTAGAYTDVPEQLDDFISQRRRWLNGSFFAAVYSVCNFYKIWFTDHSLGRKLFFQLQFTYQLLGLLVSWFSLGSYFLVFRILTCYLAESSAHFAPGNVLSVFFLWLYMASLTTTFVLSFGNKPKGTKMFYLVIVIFFAVLMCYMIFAAIFLSVKAIQQILKDTKDNTDWTFFFADTQFRNLVIAILSTYILYLFGFIIYMQPIHMLTSFVQYLLLSPAYVNVLNIYAFCNIHDITWGTKGQDKINDLGIAKKGRKSDDELEIVIPTTKFQIDDGYSKMVKQLITPAVTENSNIDEDEQNRFYFAFFRSMTVLIWMFSNFILVAIVTNTGGLSQFGNDSNNKNTILPENRTFIFLSVILYTVAFMALFRFLGSSIYLIQRGLNKLGLRS